MKTTISNLAAQLSKHLQIKQIFVVALAGFLLLTSVACSPSSPSASGEGSYRERVAQPTNDKTYQPSDGLNSFDDYGDRNAKALETKAKAVVDRAKQNTSQVKDAGDLVDEIKSGAPNPAKDAGKVINQATDRASRDAKAGFQNLQKNIDRAGDEAKGTVQEATGNAAQVGKDAQRSLEDTARFAKEKAEDTTDAVRSRI